MEFAKKQLEKYGWTEGKGLGRNEDGISEALRTKLKFDNAGVGHDVGAQFTNNWWERVFNTAASNMNVKVDGNEVKFELNDEPVEISTRSYSLKSLKKNKHFEYGNFLKTAKYTSTGTENFNVEVPEPVVTVTSLTDEELFLACGGRTAHKGARHGLKLSGKLSRIEKQERILLKKMKNVSLTDDTTNVEKKMKKLKKHKEEVITESPQVLETSPSTSKNKKNKRKSVTFNDATVVKYYTPEIEGGNENGRDDNPALDLNSNNCDEGIEQDIEDSLGEVPDSHKSFEESQRTVSDLSKAERKKLKKKRKLEKKKKTATELFIEEVREEILEESGKKRKMIEEDFEGKRSLFTNYSKKTKYVPEKLKKKKQKKHEKKMKSIVEYLDNFCKISDDE